MKIFFDVYNYQNFVMPWKIFVCTQGTRGSIATGIFPCNIMPILIPVKQFIEINVVSVDVLKILHCLLAIINKIEIKFE